MCVWLSLRLDGKIRKSCGNGNVLVFFVARITQLMFASPIFGVILSGDVDVCMSKSHPPFTLNTT